MKKFGRKLVRALFVSGTIAAGFAINSTSSLAAEIKDVDTQSLTTAENDAKEGQISENSLQTMEDAVGVIEGDAVAEEGYLNQAKEGVEKGNLTPDSATEMMDGGTAVMEQAQEKKETVDTIYDAVTSETEAASMKFKEAATSYDLEENIEKVEDAATAQDKIDAVNNTAEDAVNKHAEFSNSQGKDSKEYKDVCDEVTDCEEMVAETQAEYDRLVEYGQELYEKYDDLIERLNNYENESYNYEAELVDLREEISYANKELFGLSDEIIGQGKDYAQAIAALNEVMDELKQAELRLEEAAARLNEITENVDESEYSTDISAYEAELENFNNASRLVNERSEYLKESKDNYQELKDRYASQTQYIEEKKQKYDELQAEYDKWLAENNYEEMLAEYREVEGLISENNKATSKRARNLSMQQGYLNYLNSIKNGYDVKIASDDEHFNAVIDATNRYIATLRANTEANELKNRADISFTKTSECYEVLKGVIEAYNAEYENPDVKKLFEAISEAAKNIENDLAEMEEYANQVKTESESGTLTISKADKIWAEAEAKMEDAKKNIEVIHKGYERISKKADEVADEYQEAADYVAAEESRDAYFCNLVRGLNDAEDRYEAAVASYEDYISSEYYQKYLRYIDALDLVNYLDKHEDELEIRREAYNEAISYIEYINSLGDEFWPFKGFEYPKDLLEIEIDEASGECGYYYTELVPRYMHSILDEDSEDYTDEEITKIIDEAYDKINSVSKKLRILDKYGELMSVKNDTDTIVKNADAQFEKITKAYNEIQNTINEYNNDVRAVSVEYEYTEESCADAPNIKLSFVGKIKGELEKLEAATDIHEFLNNLKAVSGTFTVVVSNRFGIIDSIKENIDLILS